MAASTSQHAAAVFPLMIKIIDKKPDARFKEVIMFGICRISEDLRTKVLKN